MGKVTKGNKFYKADKAVNVIRQDSWTNFMSGVAGKFDKTRANKLSVANIVTYEELASGYIDGGWIHKIVKVIANDMTRKWITITNDSKSELDNKLKELNAISIYNQATKWRRLFGGALIVMLSADGKLNTKMRSSAEVLQLRVYSPSEIEIERSKVDVDPTSLNFGKVILYKIKPTGNAEAFDVHASRAIELPGITLPLNLSLGYTSNFKYWGMGNIQVIFNQLANLGVFEQSMGTLSQELIVSIYKIAGLADMIAQNTADGLEKAQTRIEIMNQTKSSLHGVFLDASADEGFDKVATNLSGVPELWDRFVMALSGVSEIPVTKLTGRSAAGENATGEGDLVNYYDDVTSEQINILEEPIAKLLKILNKGVAVPFTFNPLGEHSLKEQITMRETQAKSDKIYLENGVLSPDEIRENRFEGTYSFETSIEGEGPEVIVEEGTE